MARDRSDKLQRFLGALRQGLRRGAAARAAGVSRMYVWRHLQEHPEFQEEIDRAEADACDMVEEALLRAINEKLNVPGMIFWLTNRAPDRWKDRRGVPPTGPQAADPQAEALAAILKRLEGLGKGGRD